MITNTPPSVSKGRRPLVVRGRSGGGASKEAPRLRHFFASLSFAVERKRHKALEPLWTKILCFLHSSRAGSYFGPPQSRQNAPGDTPITPCLYLRSCIFQYWKMQGRCASLEISFFRPKSTGEKRVYLPLRALFTVNCSQTKTAALAILCFP